MRDHRQLLVHRHRLVQLRTRVKNELQHLALKQEIQRKRKLWTAQGREEFESLSLERWANEPGALQRPVPHFVHCRNVRLA